MSLYNIICAVALSLVILYSALVTGQNNNTTSCENCTITDLTTAFMSLDDNDTDIGMLQFEVDGENFTLCSNLTNTDNSTTTVEIEVTAQSVRISMDGVVTANTFEDNILENGEYKGFCCVIEDGMVKLMSGMESISSQELLISRIPSDNIESQSVEIRGSGRMRRWKNPCTSRYPACKNGGICRPVYGRGFRCVCPEGTKGERCEEGSETETTVSACMNKKLVLKCSEESMNGGRPALFIKSASYGRPDIWEQYLAYKRGCSSELYQCFNNVTNDVKYDCGQFGNELGGYKCVLSANDYKPCYGYGYGCSQCSGPQFLTVKYFCARQRKICEGEDGSIGCGEGKVIKILKATWGGDLSASCTAPDTFPTSEETCPPITVRHIVSFFCDHKPSCNPGVSTSVFGSPCPGVPEKRVLNVLYGCIKKPMKMDHSFAVPPGLIPI